MFKLFIIAAILALSSARPGILHDTHHLVKTTIVKSPPVFHTKQILHKAIISEPTQIAVQEPYLAKVGERVETIPTSYSHVYRSDIHHKTLVKDIIAPVVKTYIKPVVNVKHVEVQPVIAHAETTVVKHVEHKAVVQKAIISEPTQIAIQEPYLTKVGERVETIPTSYSHVYRSDVHSKALVKDIIAPVVKTYIKPVVNVKHVEVQPITVHAEATVVKHVEVQPTIAHAETSVLVEEPKIEIEHASTAAETIIPHEVAHETSAIAVASTDAIVEAPAEVYGAPKLSAEAFATHAIESPVVHAEAHAVTSYEAPLGPVHADVKAIARVPSSEYGVPSLSSNVESFASASISAPYPAKI